VKRGPLNIAVFVSGGGSNLQALLDHAAESDLWRVVVVIMNREAGAAQGAEAAGVPVRVVPTKDRDREEVTVDTRKVLDEFEINVILLAGYLRMLPAVVVKRFEGRILNVHPALLPDFGGQGMYGLHVHRAVVASDAEVTGATVHFVTEEYDEGAILGQWQVELLPGDTPEDVAARVLRVEHKLYPLAVDHLCQAVIDKRPVERMKDVRLNEPPDQPRPDQLSEEVR
jgi:formyltetrahydrofolate-dependent phosphoribosylglycinamide formyltransferase